MTEYISDLVGSLRLNTPEQAIDLQLPINLNWLSDGQVYCYNLQEPNLPFLLDFKEKPLLPQIEIEEFRGHRVVKLKEKIKDRIEPTISMPVRFYEAALKQLQRRKEKGDLLKLIHPLPLTILNVFSMKSVQDVYRGNVEELLHDIRDMIIFPTLEYLIEKHSLKYFQGDDVAIFDGDIHKSLIDDEFIVIEDISKRCKEWNIDFACYAPDVPLPKVMPEEWNEKLVRQRLLQIPNTISWIFFYDWEREDIFQKKLRMVAKTKSDNVTLAIGLLDSNSEHYEDMATLHSKLEQAVAILQPEKLHITPIGGFKGVPPHVAEMKMKMLAELVSR